MEEMVPQDVPERVGEPEAVESQAIQIKPGDILCGRFEVIGELSQHGGHSYLCRRLTPPYKGDLARIKLFSPNKLGEDDKTAAARFQHEIVATISVRHPNVIRVDETIKVGNYLGYVAEFLAGKTLEDSLSDSDAEKLAVPQVVSFLRQLCAGTEAIHSAGIIHRSLKPRNILVTDQGHIKIIDFGLAKILSQRGLTKAGVRIGTIDYMSPEYITENTISPVIDIYALGIVAYKMITGLVPLYAEDPLEMMSLRIQSDPEPPHVLNPECSLELSMIVLKALHRNPAARYQRAIEMLRDLERLPDVGSTPLPQAPKPAVVGVDFTASGSIIVQPRQGSGVGGWIKKLFGK